MLKISIVIPVYNAGKYIERCLNSVINQTYKEIEIIIINDGSTDNSQNICEKYRKRDSRIKLINQNNKGVSFSRNVGIEKSTGDYIMFIDSDDYYDLTCIEECVNLISKNNINILKFNFNYKKGKYEKDKYNKFSVPVNKKILKDEYKNKIYDFVFTSNDFCNIWNSVIKSNLAKSNSFIEKITIGEDYLFFVQCMIKSQNIYFWDRCFYNYTVNESSITHNFSPEKGIKKIFDCFFVNNKIQKLLEEDGYIKEEQYIYKSMFNLYNNLLSAVEYLNYRNYKMYLDKITDSNYSEDIKKIYANCSNVLRQLIEKKLCTFLLLKFKLKVKRVLKFIIR